MATLLPLSDIRELKVMLEIDPDDTQDDLKLSFLITYASELIEDYLTRKLFYRSRTEYYSGTGTRYLNLKARPVFTTPTIQVWEDTVNGNAGQSDDSFSGDPLTYGTDYYLWVDSEDGLSSRSAILVRLTKLWERPWTRSGGLLSSYPSINPGSIKVIYTGGYTIDQLPGAFRLACNLLTTRLAYIVPLGMELSSESYIERSISLMTPQRNYLMSLVAPMLFSYRNRTW